MTSGVDGVKVPDLPGGTVTFLFSDIEGSTRLWESQPVLMASALAAHDQIVRDQVAAAGGTVFKHTGDGFAAVFVRVSEALGVAARITRELADRDWGPCPIRVRMGIHAGEAQPRDGDYFGVTVTRAARVMDAGSGGQVVVTDTAAGLASHLVPEGANLVDCGLHRLKDLGDPVHLWQLLVGGVDDHRALRTLESTPNNLPVRLSSFVGRRREIAEVRRALEQARLVTLTGIGGVGKTRLAMQVAADLLGGYEDGVWLVELSSLSEPELVPQTVVMALKIPTLDQPPMEALLAHLAHRRALIVLDNCEHLVDAAAKLVESVLAVTRGVDVLATSREALAVNGETQWRVSPLGIGSERDEAVELFVDRATSVLPGFELTAENRGSVETICRHLDGIPLAIELATARLTMLDAAQIADHLDDRFRLLTGGSRTAAERQRTLRAMMDWSHDLLTASERQLLRRLSVFSDGFDLEAVEAVCAADWISVFDVLDLLGRLVDVSLVVFEREPTPRYHLLETVREYADVKLQEAGEAAETHRRHAEHFDRVASRIEALVDSNHTPEGMRLGEVELANLRAAMAWSYDAGWPELGLSIAVHLWAYFFRLVSQGEALGWLRTGVDLVPAEASVLYVRALSHALTEADNRGEHDAVPELRARAEALLGEVHDPEMAADLNNALANVATMSDPRASLARYAVAIDLFLAAGSTRWMSPQYNRLFAVTVTGDLSDLEEHIDRMHQAERDGLGPPHPSAVLEGWYRVVAGQPEAALEALDGVTGPLAPTTEAWYRWVTAEALRQLGRLDECEAALAAVKRVYEIEEATDWQVFSITSALVALERGHLDVAIERWAPVALSAVAADAHIWRAATATFHGLVAVARSDWERGARLLGFADRESELSGYRMFVSDRHRLDAARVTLGTELGGDELADAQARGASTPYEQLPLYRS